MAIYAVDAVHLDIKCNMQLKFLLLLKSLIVCAGSKDVICLNSASLDCFNFTTAMLRESVRFLSKVLKKSCKCVRKEGKRFSFVNVAREFETGNQDELQTEVKKWMNAFKNSRPSPVYDLMMIWLAL